MGLELRVFSEVDLYIFLATHRDEYDTRKADQLWLLAMLIDFPLAHAEQLAARLKERGITLQPQESEYTRHWIKRNSPGAWADRPSIRAKLQKQESAAMRGKAS